MHQLLCALQVDIVLCPTSHSNGRKTRRFNQVFLPTQECELWHSLTIHVIVNKWKAHFLHFKSEISHFYLSSSHHQYHYSERYSTIISKEKTKYQNGYFFKYSSLFHAGLCDNRPILGDASSQFSHVLTEIIFVEIVFLATGSGYSDCWPYVGIICFKAFSVWDLSFFCSIEIFFDLDI